MTALIQDKDTQEQILENMYKKVQKLNEEIGLLSRALDIKTSDMANTLGFPIQRQEFMDIVSNVDTDGLRAHDATIYGAQINSLQKKLKRLQIENEDLKVVREVNNQELIELEEKRHELVLQMQALETTTRQLNDEKATLLDYVQEKDHAADENISNLENTIATQEQQLRRLKNNINVMHEQLNKQSTRVSPQKDQHYTSSQTAVISAAGHQTFSQNKVLSNEKGSTVTSELDCMNKDDLIERIKLLEQQLEKARILADEQNQQLQWLSDYYKEEIEAMKSRFESQKKHKQDPYSMEG